MYVTGNCRAKNKNIKYNFKNALQPEKARKQDD